MVRLSFCRPSLRDCCHVINGGARSIIPCKGALPHRLARRKLAGVAGRTEGPEASGEAEAP